MSKITRAKDLAFGEDMGVGNNFNSDGSTLPKLSEKLNVFIDWSGVAATINRKAYQLAQFDPQTTDYDSTTWAIYENKFSTTPFWLSTSSKTRHAEITELSLSPLIDAIANLVEAYLTPDGLKDVVTSVKKIAELAINNRGQTQKDTYSQTGLITISSSQLYVANTRTRVSFTYDEGKGYKQLKQTLKVQTLIASLDFGKCERSAHQIRKWDQTDVDEWQTGTASNDQAPNESPAWDN